MRFITEYSMPILAGLLLLLFFLALPDLSRCVIQGQYRRSKKLSRFDALIMAAITLAYSFVAFYNLGNRESPESFADLRGGAAAYLRLNEGTAASMMFYTGVGIGDYVIEYSPDGESYRQIGSFHQSHAEDLKWCQVELAEGFGPGQLRITASGNVWLGEVVLRDWDGNILPIQSSDAALSDEQWLCPEKQNYMNSSYFDEIYHARTAWEHLNGVYPYEITHPPLGKIIISLGISLFGMTPFGWRFSGTLLGVLMLPIMYVFLKKLFGGKAVPAAGSIVFASDFMHFTQTRIATIDTYSVFFILLMYLFMYLFFEEGRWKHLALSGLFFGLGAASKWTCLYAGAGLGVIWMWYWIRHKELGLGVYVKNCAFCLLFFVALPAFIYYLSYIPYARAQEGMSIFSLDYLKMVLDNQSYMFNYHSGIVSTHPYSSRWYQWLLDIRPILYYLEYFDDGTRSSFGAFVNPALCWGGLMSLFVLLFMALKRRDRTAGFILLGWLAQLLPWVFVSRLTFAYHYFPCTVFLVLSLGYVFNLLRLNCRRWQLPVWGFALGSVALFILFYPAISGAAIDSISADRLLGWLPTWPF